MEYRVVDLSRVGCIVLYNQSGDGIGILGRAKDLFGLGLTSLRGIARRKQ